METDADWLVEGGWLAIAGADSDSRIVEGDWLKLVSQGRLAWNCYNSYQETGDWN